MNDNDCEVCQMPDGHVPVGRTPSGRHVCAACERCAAVVFALEFKLNRAKDLMLEKR